MPNFVVWILWPELQIYSQGVWFFIKFKNITHEVMPILILKISGKKFADFDINCNSVELRVILSLFLNQY